MEGLLSAKMSCNGRIMAFVQYLLSQTFSFGYPPFPTISCLLPQLLSIPSDICSSINHCYHALTLLIGCIGFKGFLSKVFIAFDGCHCVQLRLSDPAQSVSYNIVSARLVSNVKIKVLKGLQPSFLLLA